eukprot:8240965-Prorocentrum_lima.AAC.1
MAPVLRGPGSSSTGPMTQSPQHQEGTEKANAINEALHEPFLPEAAVVGLDSGINQPHPQEMTWLPGEPGNE